MPVRDPYEEAAEKVVGSIPKIVDPYNAAAATVVQDQRTALRGSLYESLMANPDVAARVNKLNRDTGLPNDYISRNLPTVQRDAYMDAADRLVEKAPKTAQFLSKPENAAVSHDDTENMTLFENMSTSIQRGYLGLKAMLPTIKSVNQAYALKMYNDIDERIAKGEDVNRVLSDYADAGMAPLPGSTSAQSLASYRKMSDRARAYLTEESGKSVVELSGLTKERSNIPVPAVVGRVMNAKTFKEGFGEMMKDPLTFIAAIGPESLVQSAPGLVAAIPAGIAGGPGASMAVVGGNSMLVDYASQLVEGLQGAGVDVSNPEAVKQALKDPKILATIVEQSGKHAAVVGAFDAASMGLASKIPLPKSVTARLAGKPIATEATKLVTQMPVQAVMGAAGEAGGELAAGQELQPGQILAEAAGEFFGAPAEVVSAGMAVREEHQLKLKEAEETKQFVEGVAKAAEDSKLRARDPETFKEFVASTTDGTPAQDIYISAQTLMQSGVAEEAAKILPSVAEQLPDALASNGFVRIPTDEYVTNTAGTKVNEALVDHVQLDPNGYTFAESQEYQKTFNQEMTANLEKMLTQKQDNEQFKASRDVVRDQFLAELTGANRFTSEANQAYATMLSSYFAVEAARLGITPEEMVNRYRLNVSNKAIEGATLDQEVPVNIESGDNQLVARSEAGHVTADVRADGVHITNADVKMEARGQGEGVRLYQALVDEALSRGLNVYSDVTVQPEAARIYDALARRGYQVQQREGSTVTKMGSVVGKGITEPAFEITGRSNPENVLNQDALIGEGEVKRVLRREPGEFTAEEQAAWDDFMSQRPDADRVMDNLEKYKGTPWAKQAVEGVFTRQAMRMLINGEQPNFQSSLDSKQVKRVRETLEKRGLDGLWSLLEADGGMIGGAAKPVNNVNSSFINCDPSADCAKYCYATKGNYQYANVIVKSELVTLAVELDGVRSAQRVANEYKATAEYANDKALRLFDKGDGNMAWLPFIGELNKQGIRTQIFSKVPEFLRQVPEMNLRLLSIDDSNMELAEQNQDLPVAFVYTGKEQIDALAKIAARGQIQVVLPVKLGQKLLDGSEISELKKAVPAVKPYLCPIDSGFKKLGKTSQPGMWNCTKCDKNGGVGCFHGTATKAVMDSLEVKPASPQERAQRILELRKQINELTATNGADLATTGQLSPGRVEGLLSEVDSLLGELLRDYEPGQKGGPALEIGSGTVNEVSSPEDNLSGSGRRVIPIKRLNQSGNASGDSQAVQGNQLDQPARGQIAFADDITRAPSVISLLRDADLSTFIHESGHFFLQVRADLASRIEGQAERTAGEQAILDDMNTTLAWMGVNGTPELSAIQQWMGMSIDEQRPFHEKFARGFEAYAFEGKAPTLELQSTFQKFRAWLLDIYKQLTKLDVKLSDEVRGVMDRMLATTEQIQAAEAARNMGPLFTPENAKGLINDWKSYHELGMAATQTAIDELQARGLTDMKWLGNARGRKLKELQGTAKLLRNEAMMDARREVMTQPVYRAWQFLTTKISEDDKIRAAEKRKSSLNIVDPQIDSLFVAIAKMGGIKKNEAISQWGIDPKEKITPPVFGKPVLRVEGGKTLDEMAAALAEDGYIATDENGKYDINELEEKFLDEVSGRTQYSMFMDPSIFMEEGLPGQNLDLTAMASGRFDLVGLRSLGVPDAVMERIKDLKMTAKEGIHPDLVAELFEFSSGDELVRTLAASPAPKDAINALADQLMLQRHGDLATPEGLQRAADAAIHNDARLRFLHTEAKALDTAMNVRQSTGKTNSRGQKQSFAVLPKAAREFAESMIARVRVRDLKPSQYTAAEVKAAKAAERAFAADDVATAAEEKRNQIVNGYAAKAAMNAQEEIIKAVAYFRKFDKRSKTLDPDYYDQIVQMLERFDFVPSTSLKTIDKRTSLAAWLEAQREAGIEPDIPPALENEAYRQSYKNMTVEEVRGLRDAIKQIEHLGRLKNKLLTAQDAREFAAIRDQITDTIIENAGDRQATIRTSNTLSGQALQTMKNFWASHIKVATWSRIMDGGKDGGALWEYLIRPANERGDLEVEMRKKATRDLTNLIQPVLKQGKMGGKGQFFATINRSLNKEARLAIALNMGNDSNMQRLLGGEGWTLDQIKPVLDTLTAADWQFVQAVGDYFESFRPMIAEKERRVYGKEPNWIDPRAMTVHTADGQNLNLRGWYYPVKYDPLASERAESEMDAERARAEMKGAYTSATTRRSFTKERAEAVVGRPLMYSLDGIYQGVNEVIHDLAWHEFLIDGNRLIKNPKIAEVMRVTYGPAVHQQFKTWLKDVAEGDKGAVNSVEKALGWIRQGVSVTGLGINVMSALMQPFGLTQSITRVGAKYVGKGMAKFMAAPMATAKEISEKSTFMENRALTRMRELAELRNQVKGETKVRQNIDAAAYALMMRAQQLVDIPTWWGAYEKAIAQGNDEDRAVALADQAVIDAQGSGTTKDQAAVERGGPALKLFTTFYSFVNTALNVGVEKTMTRQARGASRTGLAADYLMLYVVPVVFIAAMKAALTPGDDDDWEDPEKLMRLLAKEELSFLMGMIVGVREMAGMADLATGKPIQAYNGPAGLRMLSDIQRLGKEAQQGEMDDGLRKSIVNVASELLRLPGAQINRTITGAEALAEGKTNNPAALAFGFQEKR